MYKTTVVNFPVNQDSLSFCVAHQVQYIPAEIRNQATVSDIDIHVGNIDPLYLLPLLSVGDLNTAAMIPCRVINDLFRIVSIRNRQRNAIIPQCPKLHHFKASTHDCVTPSYAIDL